VRRVFFECGDQFLVGGEFRRVAKRLQADTLWRSSCVIAARRRRLTACRDDGQWQQRHEQS
jgi:hypothetical protein